MVLFKLLVVSLAAVAAPAAAPVIMSAAGFSAGGIAAGSLASGVMSLYGGAVPAGSAVALLQSAGAAGLAASTKLVIGSVAGSVAAAVTAWTPGGSSKRASSGSEERSNAGVDDPGVGSSKENEEATVLQGDCDQQGEIYEEERQ